MQHHPLGESGLMVSTLALGTWAMGADERTWGLVDDRESVAAIEHAIEGGITLIDTAPIYGLGHSEEIVGRAIQGKRDRVLLATKCGLMFPTSANALPARCLAPSSIVRECEQSLRRLHTDVIDLYQCHWPDPNTPIEETMNALVTLHTQGKIRAIGLSNYSCEEISRARAVGPVHAIQSQFSLLSRRAEEDLIPYCIEYRIAVLAYSPLAKGLLTGKFSERSHFSDIRGQDPEFQGERFRRNLRTIDTLRSLANGYGKSLSQFALNWAAGYPGVTAPIVGAKRPSQVKDNLGAIGWSITDDDRRRIDAMLKG